MEEGNTEARLRCEALTISHWRTTMNEGTRRWKPVTLGDAFPPPAGPYSPAVRAGDLVFVSGQVPRDPMTGALVGATVEEQARQTLANLSRALEAAGARISDVVSVTVYLADENDWGAFNGVYTSVFARPYPTRTVVGSQLRGVLVEISAVAWLGPAR
jgi:2-iminobutanoate/2-iminopropanoate deaminase